MFDFLRLLCGRRVGEVIKSTLFWIAIHWFIIFLNSLEENIYQGHDDSLKVADRAKTSSFLSLKCFKNKNSFWKHMVVNFLLFFLKHDTLLSQPQVIYLVLLFAWLKLTYHDIHAAAEKG